MNWKTLSKIDIKNLKVGLVKVVDERGFMTGGYDGTAESLRLIAEKVNEIIEFLQVNHKQ